MENYKVTKNGSDTFILDSEDTEYMSISCTQIKNTTFSVFSCEAIKLQTDGKKVLVKWPDIKIELGDRLEVEITEETGTIEPKIMHQTGRIKEPHREGNCSFCFKKTNEVKKIVFGPDGTNICNECVDLSQRIISGGGDAL